MPLYQTKIQVGWCNVSICLILNMSWAISIYFFLILEWFALFFFFAKFKKFHEKNELSDFQKESNFIQLSRKCLPDKAFFQNPGFCNSIDIMTGFLKVVLDWKMFVNNLSQININKLYSIFFVHFFKGNLHNSTL